MIRASLLLAAELACYVLFFRGWRWRGWVLPTTRTGLFRRRIVRTLGWFGLTGWAGVAALGRPEAGWAMPPEFRSLAAPATDWAGPDLASLLLAGMAGGTVLGLIWTAVRRRRGKPPVMLGDFGELIPRTPGEAQLALGAALAAGVAEELFFRLALPLMATIVTGSAALGFAGATILFGLAHRYQRWPGVLATTLAGALFAGLYLASGRLWWAMATHALIDVNALVLRPWVGGLIRRG